MLSTALQNTQQLINTIRGLPAPPDPAGQMQAQVAQTGDQLIPALSSARDNLLAFTAGGVQVIDALTSEAAAGGDPASAVKMLHELGAGFDQNSSQLAPLSGRLDQFRDRVAQDIGAMANEQVQLNSQLAGLSAERDRWSEQQDSLNQRSTTTDILSIFFGPLAIAGSELASAIQYGESTEAALNEANEHLAQVAAQAHALQAAVDACNLLSSASGQLSSAVQNLANALSLIRADLTDDAVRAATATPVTLRLFLAALRSAMSVLQNGAG